MPGAGRRDGRADPVLAEELLRQLLAGDGGRPLLPPPRTTNLEHHHDPAAGRPVGRPAAPFPAEATMANSDLTEFLGRIELLRDLTADELQRLVGALQRQSLPAGSLLFSESSPRRNLFLVRAGEIELYKPGPLGRDLKLAAFGAGDFLGEGALMDDYPHSTSARVVADAELYVLSRDDFAALTRERPELAPKLLARAARVIARRMRQASARVSHPGAVYLSGRTRTEHDLLGDREVPHEFYYGIQTLRALENFPISGIGLDHFPVLIEALAMVKLAAARANRELGHLEPPVADAIDQACREIVSGRWHNHFVVDMIQGGAGTSTNMNANEVIANRALELLGHERGEYRHCSPNSHVNMAQSTNDVYPSALKIALIRANESLLDVLHDLVLAFQRKGDEFAGVIKMGRTQLQDAVPMTLGQSFHAWGHTLAEEIERLSENARLFLELNLGGTAIGTGINADPRYADTVIRHLREVAGLEVRLASDLVEATQDTGAFVMFSSAIKRLAVKLSKICNDLRLLSSGPRAGLNEIDLPRLQPGSSIMPGKVNPVIPEVVNQIAFKVIGNDLTVTLAAEAGQLELNVMEPVIVQSLLESMEMLENGMAVLQHRCIDGITANADVCRRHVEASIGLITALNPVLGYEACTVLAREALETGRGVYDLVLEKGLLSRAQLDDLLAPEKMIGPRPF
ncbi:MAG: aspartate ammonia-lyase [Candidatus Krumholzibacteriia bacterium]